MKNNTLLVDVLIPTNGINTYFKNRINVFWQPFGETTQIELQ